MKNILEKMEESLADAALLEMGVVPGPAVVHTPAATFAEILEENLVEVAFAEAADYDEIHDALQREHRYSTDTCVPDECQYADNDLCFVQV